MLSAILTRAYPSSAKEVYPFGMASADAEAAIYAYTVLKSTPKSESNELYVTLSVSTQPSDLTHVSKSKSGSVPKVKV